MVEDCLDAGFDEEINWIQGSLRSALEDRRNGDNNIGISTITKVSSALLRTANPG